MNHIKKVFSFSGRISCEQFWNALIAIQISSIFLIVITLLIAKPDPEVRPLNSQTVMFFMVAGCICLLNTWVSLAVGAKRWHDRDKSALMIIIFFIPVIGAIWTIIELGFLTGTSGPNKCGDDPYQKKRQRLINRKPI